MPKRKVQKIVEELINLIKQQFPDLKGLYLYGSQVKGESHKDSDIDVLGLFDSISWEKNFEIAGILCELNYKYDTFIDFKAYTPDELEQNPVYYNEVVNEGLFFTAA